MKMEHLPLQIVSNFYGTNNGTNLRKGEYNEVVLK